MAPKQGLYINPASLPTAPHHQSFSQLWKTKWQSPAKMGVYPFMFGSISDFEGVLGQLDHMKEPYDWDAFSAVFLPAGDGLVDAAKRAEQAGETEKAREYYLRASAVYRMARFPTVETDQQRLGWERAKTAAFNGLKYNPTPVTDIAIPFKSHTPAEPSTIPAAFCLPDGTDRVPVVILVTGLDGYRVDLAVWAHGFAAIGVACLIHEIPGTGDCPADKTDPKSADRMYDDIFDWIDRHDRLDPSSVFLWGFSTGGYYSIRAAHTHPDRLAGVVTQGGGCHYMFDVDWLDQVNRLEYPFELADSLAHKFGYDDVDQFKRESIDRFSLLLDGTLDKPVCAPLLVVNGYLDEIFPVDDCFLLADHGAPKEIRLVQNQKHMGEPDAFFIILKWLYKKMGLVEKRMKSEGCESGSMAEAEQVVQKMVGEHMQTLPFKAQFPTP